MWQSKLPFGIVVIFFPRQVGSLKPKQFPMLCVFTSINNMHNLYYLKSVGNKFFFSPLSHLWGQFICIIKMSECNISTICLAIQLLHEQLEDPIFLWKANLVPATYLVLQRVNLQIFPAVKQLLHTQPHTTLWYHY
jgi:hypothetical protein